MTKVAETAAPPARPESNTMSINEEPLTATAQVFAAPGSDSANVRMQETRGYPGLSMFSGQVGASACYCAAYDLSCRPRAPDPWRLAFRAQQLAEGALVPQRIQIQIGVQPEPVRLALR
jgi:hypothetical protein